MFKKLSKISFLLGSAFLLLVSSYALSANEPSVCDNGIHVFDNGDFRLDLKPQDNRTDLSHYAALNNILDHEHVWLLFSPDIAGELTFNASIDQGALNMVVFKAEKGPVCAEIQAGKAEIARLHVNSSSKITGLDYMIGEGVLYALELKQGDQIAVLFTSPTDAKKALTLSWKFTAKDATNQAKIVDRRNDDFAPTQKFAIVDEVSKRPLIANLSIEGSQHNDGLYIGSEFLFNVSRNCKLTVKCDVEGYFYHDSIYTINASEDNEFIIELARIAKGKSISIQSLEFVPGSTELKESSIPDLRRLRDFLALNSGIHIEIQGHVFALGENTIAAQRVSEARAKRVMKYLTDNGIDKSRLEAVGYGNSRPLYEKPKFFYEEQANRRVEIVVK